MPSIYQLSPPLLAMKALRIDSSLSNFALAYEADCKFFGDYRERNTLIREAFMNEFDLEMPNGDWLQIPKLWCLVSKASCGIHSVVPIYRGRKFWSFIKDDAALALVLVAIARREGIDAHEFITFEQKVIAKNKQIVASAGGTIH